MAASGEGEAPEFGFELPVGYVWLQRSGLVQYKEFSKLEPWYFLDRREAFEVTNAWPNGPYAGRLVGYARRQDCDDIACFAIASGVVKGVVLIEGWQNDSYVVLGEYPTFWDWVKSVIDDVAAWTDMTNREE